MKVLLSLLGAVAITSSSTALTTSNVFVNHKQEQARLTQNDSDIDWKTLEDETISYFDNFKQQQLFSTNNSQSNEIEQAINYAKEKSLSYVKLFSEQNLSLEEIINQISNEFPEFKTNYENSINKVTKNQMNFSDFNLDNLFSKTKSSSAGTYSISLEEIIHYLTKTLSNLRTWKVTASTIAALSAVAAAGFWAAAWWFGITAPWAIACTSISTISSLISLGIGKIINAYEGKPLPEAKEDALALGDWLFGDLEKELLARKGVLFSFKWAFSAVSAIFAVFDAIDDWKDFAKNV